MTLPFPFIHKNIWLTALTALVIISIAFFLLHHVSAAHLDAVANGSLADIVITFPLAYYFLIVRPLRVRRWSMMLVFSCCCLVAYLILPAHQQAYILQLRKLSMLAELGLVVYCISKFKKIKAVYRDLQAEYSDPAYHLYQSMTIVLGNHAGIKFLATELSMLRFGLLFWKKQKQPAPVLSMCSVHKESGYGAFFGVILGVCVIELIGMHLLLMRYSPTSAWVLTAFSIYGTLFLIGDYSAIVKNGVLLMDNCILLRTGLRWRAMVGRNSIVSITPIGYNYQLADNCFKGGAIKDNVNVLITFKEPVSIERLYRKPVVATQIAMCIDDAGSFAQVVFNKN